MAKGQQRGNREAKKPKKAKPAPAAAATRSVAAIGKQSVFVPSRKG